MEEAAEPSCKVIALFIFHQGEKEMGVERFFDFYLYDEMLAPRTITTGGCDSLAPHTANYSQLCFLMFPSQTLRDIVKNARDSAG